MLRLRSRISVTRPREDQLAVQSNTGRRVLFGGIAALLVVAFLVGVDWEHDFENGMVAGTVFYFGITAICIAVAGRNSVLLFDGSDRSAHFVTRIFGIRLSHAELDLTTIRSVVLQVLHFLREGEGPRPGLLNSRFQGHVERRTVYYKLYLESDEKLHFVQDSTDASDLEGPAQAIADFLGVTYRREEL